MRIFLHKETTECQNFAISVTLCIGGNEGGGGVTLCPMMEN